MGNENTRIMSALGIAIALSIAVARRTDAETVVFQEDSGYVGTQDTYLQQNQPNSSSNDEASQLAVSNGNGSFPVVTHALLKFDNIFGPSAVPIGSTITAAQLKLWTNTPSVHGTVHKVLFDWSEQTLTFGSVGVDGVSANDIEAASTPTATLTPGTLINMVTIDVTSDVQSWAAGEANNGWAFLPNLTASNYWGFYSSEDQAAFNDHPELTIQFAPATVPEPSSVLLLCTASLGMIRRRRYR